MKTNFSLVLFFLLITLVIRAQEKQGETFRITDNGSVLNVQSYVDALSAANMKNHRLKNKRYTIIFNTGVKVELFSAAELIANGRKIDLADYPEEFDSSRQEPMFYLGQNNYIMEEHSHRSKAH
jgi:hypothetical protein